MIKFKKVPQAGLPQKTFEYTWQGRELTVQFFDVARDEEGKVSSKTLIAEEVYDFSPLEPGELAETEPETLPEGIDPIVVAETDDAGDLHVTVVAWYDPEYEQPPTVVEEVIDE